jgi:hypothetical protein
MLCETVHPIVEGEAIPAPRPGTARPRSPSGLSPASLACSACDIGRVRGHRHATSRLMVFAEEPGLFMFGGFRASVMVYRRVPRRTPGSAERRRRSASISRPSSAARLSAPVAVTEPCPGFDAAALPARCGSFRTGYLTAPRCSSPTRSPATSRADPHTRLNWSVVSRP